MEKVKQYKYIILIGIIVLGFSFYWYEIRQVNIKKDCIEKAVQETIDKGGDQTDVRYRFWKCSNEKGL